MKKYILSVLGILLFALGSYGQVIPKPNPTAVGIGYKRLLADSTIFIPTGGATPRLGANNINRRSAIYADSVNKKLYIFYPDSTWKDVLTDSTKYVPYYGANNDVFLGNHGVRTDYTQYSIVPVAVDSVGRLRWNDTDGTLNLRLKGGNVTLQIGQESVRYIHNNTGVTLNDGQVVYITGSTGELPSVGLASASSEATSSVTYGVVTEPIAHGSNGFITTYGLVHGLNTNAFIEGSAIWLSDTAGAFRQYPPAKPSHQVLIGYVVKKAGGNGSIDVKIQNGYELDELHNVSITSPANNDGLFYESSSSLWKNKSIATALGYTPANNALVVKYTDTTSMLSSYYNKTASNSLLALKQDQLNGTGFVKASGTTISYDNSTYLTTSSAASTYVPYTGATGTLNLNNQSLTNAAFVGSNYSVQAGSSATVGGLFQYLNGTNGTFNPSTGYTTIQGTTSYFSFAPTATDRAIFWYSPGLRGYTLPTSNGTLALTSDIPSLSGYVQGSGTINTHAKFTASSTIGNSMISDDGTTVTNIGATRSNLYLKAANNTYYSQLAFTNGSNGSFGGISYNNSGQYMQFETNSSEWIRLYGNGNFRLFSSSTTDNGAKFQVEGSATFSGNLSVNSTYGFTIGAIPGVQRIQYGSDAANSFTLLTAGNGYANLYAGAATFNIGANNAYLTVDKAYRPATPYYYGGIRFTGNNYDWGKIEMVQDDPSSSWYSRMVFYTMNGGGGALTERMSLTYTGILIVPGIYNNTTSYAANLYMGSTGTFERSTSSIKYKRDVKDYDKGLAEVLKMRPVYYKGKSSSDGEKQFAGLIAEEIDSLGLKEFVQYASDGTPDALAYQNMVALAFKAIQELNKKVDAKQAKIDELETRIITLESKPNNGNGNGNQ